jgi:hypothetical protein
MALDDGAQIDPATTPENVALMAEVDEQLANAASARRRQLALAARIADLVPTASGKIDERVIARGDLTQRRRTFAERWSRRCALAESSS